MASPQLSLVIPIYNERENIPSLVEEIHKALADLSYEIVLVDDGSTDGSDAILARMAREDARLRVILFRRNFGQTAALAAGFKEALGEIIVCLDGDLQNDPADIPALLKKMDQGFDVVSGWRYPRQDPYWSRQFPSAIANFIISKVTGVPLHDFGCTLKAYRRFTLDNLRLYGEMHRFLPAWCAWRGARVGEITVHHRPRTMGRSKYGLNRIFKVILDLLTTQFMNDYFSKPNYLFGGLGLVLYGLGVVSAIIVFYDKFGPDRWAPFRIPLLILTTFLWITGTLLFVMGLVAELIVRTYYDLSAQRPYRIREIVSSSGSLTEADGAGEPRLLEKRSRPRV